MRLPLPTCRAILLLAAISLAGQQAAAQTDVLGRYSPLDHRVPGRASHWTRVIHPPCEEYVQPVRIELPSRGLVTFYDRAPENAILTQAPSQAGMLVGQTYRFRISGMPEFPGVELYPSVEVLDRLHPPLGREEEFPIPIQLTEEEIATALDDHLVTKVVYLEQPQLADPQPAGRPLKLTTLPAAANLVLEAEYLGRPMAIVRLGGRVPDPSDPADRHFFGSGAPVSPNALPPERLGEPLAHRPAMSAPLAVE